MVDLRILILIAVFLKVYADLAIMDVLIPLFRQIIPNNDSLT
jgi:hypothetical protein